MEIGMLNFGLIISWLLSQTVVQTHYNRKQLSNEIRMAETEAKFFLSHGNRVKRSTTPSFCYDMSKESTCELRSSECRTEEFREYLCRKGIKACPGYLMCTIDAYSNWCPAHYSTQCTNVCDTLVPRCKNGGTCINISTGDYRCICPGGFNGKDCANDIDECLGQPCQPNHYCENLFGNYSCNCQNGLGGENCDLDRCKMGPVDIVFLVDSSVSQGKDNFSKQLGFIKEFIKSVYVGETFFRVSVITFSFDARVQFNFTKYLENETLLDAIDRIHYNPGVTNTGRALRTAREDVLPSNRTDVTKRVIILTNSMFSNKSDTIMQARLLKDAGVTIVAIGIGSDVAHAELLEIASDYSDVHTVSTFDGLYRIQDKIERCVYEDTLTPDFCRIFRRFVNLYTLERRMLEWNGIKLYSSSPEGCRITFSHYNSSYPDGNKICFYIANFMGHLGTYLQLFVFDGWLSGDKYKEKIFTNNFTSPSEYCYDRVPAGFILYTPDDQRGTGYLRIYVTIETIKKIPEEAHTNYIPYILGGVGAFVLIVACIVNDCNASKTCECLFTAALFLILFPFLIIYGCIYGCCITSNKKSSRVLTQTEENRDAAGSLGCCRFRSQNQQQTTPEIEISALSVISNQASSYAVADAETGASSSDEQSELPYNSNLESVMSVEVSSDEVRDDKTNCSCLSIHLFHKVTRTDNN